jgi:hypothetical protein
MPERGQERMVRKELANVDVPGSWGTRLGLWGPWSSSASLSSFPALVGVSPGKGSVGWVVSFPRQSHAQALGDRRAIVTLPVTLAVY